MNQPRPADNSLTVGVLSDTHGTLRPEVEQVLAGCAHILHAGDIGSPEVLERLARIAPVMAVRGNMDYGRWSHSLPVHEMIEIDGVTFYILHDLNHLDLDPVAAGIHVVVSGHTHRPQLSLEKGVTYLNPGSAAHGRYGSSASVAVVRIDNGHASPCIVDLNS